jgi:arylsulfatase A-like enzyme
MPRLFKLGILIVMLAISSGVLLIAPACSVLNPPGNQDPAKPNVILIITDDQPVHTLDYMPIVQKELVARGINFTQAYVTTPLCCPSRSSILTGLYAQHTGVLTNRPGAPAFEKNDATLGVWFHQAGYRTFLLGKYFNNIDLLPVDFVPPGWDDYQIFWNRDKNYANFSFYNGYNYNENGKIISYGDQPEAYSTDVLTQKALDFISSSGSQPFLIWLGYYGPHYPYESAARHQKMFKTDAEWSPYLPPNFMEDDRSDKPEWMRNQSIRMDDAFDADQAILRSLQSVDEGIGKILALLEKRQIRDNTIIIFLSDNGLAIGEHQIIGKDCPYEECIKVPFIIDYPALITAPRVESQFALNIDIAPTLADLAGIPLPTAVDGVSLVPVLQSASAPGRESFFFEHYRDTEADDPSGLGTTIPSFWGIRTAGWKYVEYETGEKELYNLVNDPYEMQNIINQPGTEQIVATLSGQLQAFRP